MPNTLNILILEAVAVVLVAATIHVGGHVVAKAIEMGVLPW